MKYVCSIVNEDHVIEIFKEFAMANSKVGYFKTLKEFEVGKEHLLLKTEDIRVNNRIY